MSRRIFLPTVSHSLVANCVFKILKVEIEGGGAVSSSFESRLDSSNFSISLAEELLDSIF
jgi:hypothetical protein